MGREFTDNDAREVYVTAHRDYLVSYVSKKCEGCVPPRVAARLAVEQALADGQNPADLDEAFKEVLSECKSGLSIQGNDCSGLEESPRGHKVCGHPTPYPEIMASEIIELSFGSSRPAEI